MTGGTEVVLGETGRNFGAGMSGGRAYVFDPEDLFPKRYNNAMVGLQRLTDDDEAKKVAGLVNAHVEATESPFAQALLKDWSNSRSKFWVVVPHPAFAPPSTPPVHEVEPKTPPAGAATKA
jgi:glutamate synthase domain-containing protein 3